MSKAKTENCKDMEAKKLYEELFNAPTEAEKEIVRRRIQMHFATQNRASSQSLAGMSDVLLNITFAEDRKQKSSQSLAN